jgi:putative transposase
MHAGLQILKGRAFRYGNRRIVFSHRSRGTNGKYYFNDSNREVLGFTGEELEEARSNNELLDWVDEQAPADGESRRRGRLVWELAEEDEREAARRAHDYVTAWAAAPRTPRSARGLTPLIAEVFERRKREAAQANPPRLERWAPTPSCLNNWISKWLKGDRKMGALVPQTHLRGNRRPRLSFTIRELMDEFLNEHYLTRQRLSGAEVHRRLEKHIEKLNEKRTLGAELPVPSQEALRRAIDELCPFTKDFCRRGSAYAREKWRAIGPGYVTERANEVWEIDDTRADIICVGEDGKTVIGRPWLTMVIDRHTRMIMSFVVSFSPPDTRTVMEALRLAIKGMGDLVRKYPEVRGSYAAKGRPDFVHVDNGKHYNSRALKDGLARLGIGHRALPVGKAWYKGVIERAFGTVSRQVFHTEPGTTYSSIFERDNETPPETVAVATLPELRMKLLTWIVEQYQVRHHRGIDDAPCRLWAISVASHPAPFPLAAQDIDAALSMTVERTAGKKGFQFRHLQYRSKDVLALTMTPGFEGGEVVLRVDENNLEVIEFLNPFTSEWKKAFLLETQIPQVRGRTLEEYDLARALRRNKPNEFGDSDPDFKATYAELDRITEEKASSDKLAKRQQAEAAKERQLQQAVRLTHPKDESTIAVGEDLASQIDKVAHSGNAPASLPDADQVNPANPFTQEARKKLGARVNRKET